MACLEVISFRSMMVAARQRDAGSFLEEAFQLADLARRCCYAASAGARLQMLAMLLSVKMAECGSQEVSAIGVNWVTVFQPAVKLPEESQLF